MIDKTLAYLDYSRLLDVLKHYASTPYIEDSLSSPTLLHDIEKINERLDKVEAVLQVVKWDGKIPFYEMPDIRIILKRVHLRDSVLDEREFLAISGFLRNCTDIVQFLKRTHEKRPYIIFLIDSIKPISHIYTRISKTISPEGHIEDTASYDLSRIRSELFLLKERARKRLERIMEDEEVRPILQDTYISIRNDRYVIPVKPNFNQAFQGIVHDYSHSLKTSFVEPMELVELNNSLNMLEKEAEEEEKNILADLTEFVRASATDLEGNMSALKDLDFFHSLALFSAEYGCVRPELTLGGELEIKEAINPFIAMSKKDETVPIDVILEKEKRAMIISGPNAGGKTAALKTIGLIAVMAQSGFFVPAHGRPRIPLFSRVAAVIGDEQDISMELSSFTAHMSSIKALFVDSPGNDLVLIDEIGGSTEPQEASALAMAIMDTFVERNSTIIVTTHLNLLKAYGYTRPFAINVATAFDQGTMKPLYKLVYGAAGYSNAISVAKSIGLSPDIIDRSYDYLGKQEYMLNDLITSLEIEKQRAAEEQQDLARLRGETRKRLALIREKRDEYLKRLEERYDKRLADLEEELEAVRKEIAKKEKIAIKIGKEKLAGIRRKYIPETLSKQDEIGVGDYVRVKTLGTRGYVAGFDKTSDEYEVVTGNLRTKIEGKHLEKVAIEAKRTAEKKAQIHVEELQEPEINLMGMRAEEALSYLDRFVDRAYMQGLASVRIVHGIGTGRLMNAVRKHLQETGYIKALRTDQRNAGVTIVDLQ